MHLENKTKQNETKKKLKISTYLSQYFMIHERQFGFKTTVRGE